MGSQLKQPARIPPTIVQLRSCSWFSVLVFLTTALAIPDIALAVGPATEKAEPESSKASDPKDPKDNKPANIGEKKLNLGKEDKDFQTYLDRLMLAESGGNDNAKNPRSTALGPYQFINSTFITVARRYFAEDIAGKTTAQILSLRTNRAFARKAAAAYSKENAATLEAEDIAPTYGNLRLAFLLGPGGAIRVLKAKPKAKLSTLLGRRIIRANPFMARMTAADLIERCTNEISIDPTRKLSTVGFTKPKSKKPRIKVRCNLSRPSCRRWLSLKKQRLRIEERAQAKKKSKSAK